MIIYLIHMIFMGGSSMADNIFKRKQTHSIFSWDGMGNIEEGRGDLGEGMPVLVYRLLTYTMLDVLTRRYGKEEADDIFRDAGYLAGSEFAKNVLDLSADFGTFISTLQSKLKELKIGILRMENFEAETGAVLLTVGQDLDCSGLPTTGEMVCVYDEGFLAGVLEAYTKKPYRIREIDCWANGDRVCRFSGSVLEQEKQIS